MTTTKRRAVTMTAAVGAMALGLAACGSDSGDGDGAGSGDGGGEASHLEELQESGTIVVGINGEEPYSFLDDAGDPTGATIAIHEAVFAEMGIDTIEATVVEWDALIPGLQADRFDAISAGMSILPERCEQADFGVPEIMYTTALMVPEGNPNNLSTLQDLVDTDLTMSAMSGAIEQGYAEDLGIEVSTVGTPEDGLEAVEAGRVDAFALTGISLRALAERNADAAVEVTEPFVAEIDGVSQVGAGATVFAQGDDEFREAYNEAYRSVIGSAEDFEAIVGEFGFTEAEYPGEDITTEMLCAGELPEAG
ncbi:transporter substrate-binding domain-containing protein [Ruania halotolerans]|uniref:transporter substrate-binding domain-containing protein n=1 Tax=Ruania halotolerans TaxID=2897773 RepID=UPI001E4FA4D2|nr:transporter substrate-binding domain-containing protein [Ruania halotolerans]UFU05445.1 transporter substrate-binding domain-containing protein [Ruania halotolerans]